MSVKRYDATRYVEMREYSQGNYVLHSDYAALLASHNALREAVAWERECREYHNLAAAWDELLSTDAYCPDELTASLKAARAEVDRLIANADDCEGEG